MALAGAGFADQEDILSLIDELVGLAESTKALSISTASFRLVTS